MTIDNNDNNINNIDRHYRCFAVVVLEFVFYKFSTTSYHLLPFLISTEIHVCSVTNM